MRRRPPRATLFPYTTRFRSVVERMDATGAWGVVATTQVVDNGTFTALWRTDRLGRVPLRATVDRGAQASAATARSEEHTSELQSRQYLVCRLLLEEKEVGSR